ncbi:MAG TPA: PHP domain-containing protein [Candidatus Polarisedimenticolia bacterium]|nr:PHP domain-containing protein [Candidatus Polarisedimenticolia bacterium]
MPIADPHCHTKASDGMVTPAELVSAAVAAGLHLIAVTDHDTMRSVKEVQERGQAMGLQVVPGQEVTTAWPAQTHVLGWFLERPVRMGMSLADTVAAIHDQGALAIVPHPFIPIFFGSIQPGMLRRLLEVHPLDGIEVMFTVPIGRRRRKALDSFVAANAERLGAQIGGSDSHFGSHDIARVVTAYEGDFRTAILERRTRPRIGMRHAVPTGIALRQQWRALVEVPIKRLRGQL